MRHYWIVAFALLFVASPAAKAAEWYDGIYFEGRGGVIFPSDTDVEFASGGNEDLEYDPGLMIEGAVGYAFDFGLRTEGAISYRRAEYDELGSSTADGTVEYLSFMGNVYYDLHLKRFGVKGTLGNLTPFAGVGVGIVSSEVDGDLGDGSGSGLAGQITLGLAYSFSENVSASMAFNSYRTSTIDYGDLEGNFASNELIFGLRYSF